MSSSKKPSFIERITKDLHLVERALFVALVIGFVIAMLKVTFSVMNVSLLGLSIVYFLFAFKPPAIQSNEGEVLGFASLLGSTILPKVMWISCSVSVMGLLFYQFSMRNDAYKQMLLVGGATIAVCLVLTITLLAQGSVKKETIVPALLRAVPLCFIDAYTLFG